MDLRPYIDSLGHEFGLAAEASGPEAQALIERLVVQLESGIRLTLLEALSGAADEITRDLAPGSVHVRLQGREPAFVVTTPEVTAAPAPPSAPAPAPAPTPGALVPAVAEPPTPETEDGGTTRINLRLPDHLKAAAEAAAARERLSVNAWLVRAVAAAVEPVEPAVAPRRPPPPPAGASASPAGSADHRSILSTFQEIAMSTYDAARDFAFPATGPITLELDVPVGDVEIRASSRADATVEVRPTNPSRRADTDAAQQTRATFTDGTLVVTAPRSWRRYGFFGTGPSVDVVVCLPAGSRVRAEASWTAIRSDGRLGDVQLNTSGDVRLDETQDLEVRCTYGNVSVRRITGQARVTTSHGTIRLQEVEGSAVVENSSGECWIGAVSGDARITNSSGNIAVEHARGSVTARTAYGSLRVADIVRGAAELQSSYGAIEVGVHAGTAAWLDVSSTHGRIHQALAAAGVPEAGDPLDTVELRVTTTYGDITIHRA